MNLTPLGVFHTILSLVAVVAALAALITHHGIAPRSGVGRVLHLVSRRDVPDGAADFSAWRDRPPAHRGRADPGDVCRGGHRREDPRLRAPLGVHRDREL